MAQKVKVAVTGAGGQIGYSILFRIASGEVFGPQTKVHLSLVEVPAGVRGAEGTAMEIEDCAFSCLEKIDIHDNPQKGFEGVNWALLVGSKPRGPGMERADLLKENGKIFIEQGRALQRGAADVCAVVVGNPCNTNALIAMRNAPDLAKWRFSAMTMLDENRAKAQIAKKAGVNVGEVQNLAIWGNHSVTMFPHFEVAKVGGKPVTSVCDRKWLESDFLTTVQKRGAAIIEARGKSSAASAANACLDHVRNLAQATPAGKWFSAAVLSDGNPYGIPDGLMYSFPLRSKGNGQWEFVSGLEVSEYARGKMKATADELLAERNDVKEMLG